MNLLELRLTKVIEECAEVAQRCTKAQRFGMDETQPTKELNNRARILEEFAGLLAAMQMVFGADFLTLIPESQIELAITKAQKYEDYSRKLGLLK